MIPFCDKAALLVGLLGFLSFLFNTWFLLACRHIAFHSLAPYVFIAAYSIGSGFLTAAGRGMFGAEQALTSRYIPISNLFWLTNLVVLYLARNTTTRNATRLTGFVRKYAQSAIVIATLLVIISSAHRSVSAANNRRYMEDARSELLSLAGGSTYEPVRPVFRTCPLWWTEWLSSRNISGLSSDIRDQVIPQRYYR